MEHLTALERAYLKAVAEDEYRDGNDLLAPVWASSVGDAFGRSAGGVAASLAKKGLVVCSGGAGRDATIELTPAGVVALNGGSR